MKFTETKLKDAYVIELEKYGDERGFFARAFCKKEYEEVGLRNEIVQINDSLSKDKGTLRGMHYQLAPKAEDKIVRCIKGSLYDVIIDIRKDSETFGEWIGVELSAENRKMLFVPKGFAHGFQTLEPNCELLYLHTEFYSPDCEGAVRFDDPKVGIKWPLDVTEISERDKNHALLSEDFEGILV